MAEFTTIARPYAKAAFDFAVESNNVDSWLEMITFMGQIVSEDAVVSMFNFCYIFSITAGPAARLSLGRSARDSPEEGVSVGETGVVASCCAK